MYIEVPTDLNIDQFRTINNRYKLLSNDEEAELAFKEIADVDILIDEHFTDGDEMA